MKWYAGMVMMFVAASCGDNLSGGNAPESPVDVPPPVDALPADTSPGDVPPPDLAELCDGEPVTIDEWEACYQRRWCQSTVTCLSLNTYHDVQECLGRSDEIDGGRLAAERRERKRAFEQHRAAINKDAFTQCLREMDGTHCNTVAFSVACATRFIGTIGDDDLCYTGIECASPGATCESSCSDACCAGSCQPKFKLNELCDLFASCEPGLVCHHTCLSGDVDTSCTSFRDCDADAWCHDGRCETDLAPRATCINPSQCGGDTTCVGLSIFDPTPGQCLRISKAGDLCDVACYGNLYCDASGVCRDLPELDQSCSAFVPCRGVDTICSNGQCVLRGGSGVNCGSGQPCRQGLFCTSELNDPNDSNPMCVPLGGKGAMCTAPSHCESYRCSGNASQPGVCLAWSDTCSLSEI